MLVIVCWLLLVVVKLEVRLSKLLWLVVVFCWVCRLSEMMCRLVKLCSLLVFVMLLWLVFI